MRNDEMLRLSLECARAAVRGEAFAGPLATGIEQILRVDAGVVVLNHHLTSDGVIDGMQLGSSPGGPIPSLDALQAAAAVAHRHPGYAPQRFFSPHVLRLSDVIPIGPFRETDVWAAVHGHSDHVIPARYPAAANLGRHGDVVVLAALHRHSRDVDDDEMAALDVLVRSPLVQALAFRHAWDQAIHVMTDCVNTATARRITRRETQVLTMAAAGATNRRIAHTMGISERTVRKHLENINDKLGTSNRAAAAARWREQQVTPS